MKLTNTLRAKIAGNAIAHGFEAGLNTLNEEAAELCRLVVEEITPKEILDVMKVERLAKYLDTASSVHIYDAGQHLIQLNGAESSVPKNHRYGSQQVQLMDLSKPLQARIDAHRAAMKDHNTSVISTKAKIDALLESVGTVAKLLDVWPEAAEFIPEIERKAALPVVRVEDINKALGLAA